MSMSWSTYDDVYVFSDDDDDGDDDGGDDGELKDDVDWG